MTESQVVNRWLEQGAKRGEAKARNMLQAHLERVLQKQFQQPVPQALHERLTAADLDTLDRWFNLALNASSLEDFEARLNGA